VCGCEFARRPAQDHVTREVCGAVLRVRVGAHGGVTTHDLANLVRRQGLIVDLQVVHQALEPAHAVTGVGPDEDPGARGPERAGGADGSPFFNAVDEDAHRPVILGHDGHVIPRIRDDHCRAGHVALRTHPQVVMELAGRVDSQLVGPARGRSRRVRPRDDRRRVRPGRPDPRGNRINGWVGGRWNVHVVVHPVEGDRLTDPSLFVTCLPSAERPVGRAGHVVQVSIERPMAHELGRGAAVERQQHGQAHQHDPPLAHDNPPSAKTQNTSIWAPRGGMRSGQ